MISCSTRTRHLFAIGYNVSLHRLDTSCYDLLASEARLGSYVAIAPGRLNKTIGSGWDGRSQPQGASRR